MASVFQAHVEVLRHTYMVMYLEVPFRGCRRLEGLSGRSGRPL